MIEDQPSLPFGIDSQLDSLWIDCYVRADPSPVLYRQIEHICDRLRGLQETACIADFQVKQWPPRQELAVDTEPGQPTRTDIVADFEAWADRNGYTLTPAFQRQTVSAAPLGSDDPETLERLRVPQIALALYDDEPENGDLQGVVPYTDTTPPDGTETYTVPQWLTTVEAVATSQTRLASETGQG